MEGSTALKADPSGRRVIESAVVRFAGDSGDGMQLTGSQFTLSTALAGNDLATFPDFPAEIRAPVGTTFGVSAFQINFGARVIKTSGDELDVLVAMNPAALKVNLADVKPLGLLILDAGAFNERNLHKAGYASDPRQDGSLEGFRVFEVDMSQLTQDALKEAGLTKKEALRCKNMWALGLVYWMFGRERQATVDWLNEKFARRPEIAGANVAALNAGHAFGETAEVDAHLAAFSVPPAEIAPGLYRNITGAEALSWGLVAGAAGAELKLVFCSYPITPASSLLHSLAGLKDHGVVTFQAEDEIAAVGAAIGASYAGGIGVTSSSGPGVALKTEAIGLAISAELPLVVVNSQRAGPSTGMPTKTEQSDLYQSVFGRNGDSPLVVLAARSPADCFEVAIEAVRLATRYMTPVILLSDGYIANAAEPWRLPEVEDLPRFPVTFATDPEGFHPFKRDAETLARVWAVPGTPGLEHRIGGIEKASDSGNISYDPANHQQMTDLRRDKVLRVAEDIPAQAFEAGGTEDRLVVVGWGSTYGPISRAVDNLRAEGLPVAHLHLRHIWPLPRNLEVLLRGFGKVLVPEMNDGQLVTLLRSEYLLPAESLSKVTGKPFKISEIEAAVRARLAA
ncbi:MAG: 2-oxoacid:acceptor oxidoreductase subunit alpha [Kiloniellaceae bacterium]